MKKTNEHLREAKRIFRSLTGKWKNLEPWLDYFDMLNTYVKAGYLEVFPSLAEAYITEPALMTLANVDDITLLIEGMRRNGQQLPMAKANDIWKHIRTLAGRMHVYTEYLHQSELGYEDYKKNAKQVADYPSTPQSVIEASENKKKIYNVRETFALHVVETEYPHHLKYSIVRSSRRKWYWPFAKTSHYEIITYRKS